MKRKQKPVVPKLLAGQCAAHGLQVGYTVGAFCPCESYNGYSCKLQLTEPTRDQLVWHWEHLAQVANNALVARDQAWELLCNFDDRNPGAVSGK